MMQTVTAMLMGAVLVAASSCAGSPTRPPSSIKSDEQIIFFPSAFRSGNEFRARIHGWIFEPETDSRKRRALLQALRRILGVPVSDANPRAGALFKQRAAYFLADNKRNKSITIRLGQRTFALQPSGANGHFYGEVVLTAEDLKKTAHDGHGFALFQAVLGKGDVRKFSGRIRMPATHPLGVISDIDDTIKISNVLDHGELIANTFYRTMKPVPFMADVYENWRKRGMTFHYVSGSTWRLYPPLRAFMGRAGFPEGTFHLKFFRLKDRSFYRFIRAEQMQYKLASINGILRDFPGRKFILVGDSGEKDPEVYARIARDNPGRIRAIYIRDVRGNSQAPRFKNLFQPLEQKGLTWAIIRDGRGLLNRAH